MSRAQERFSRIRRESLERIESGQLDTELGSGRYELPEGRCVSAIARVCVNAPELLDLITATQREVGVAGDCFVYPADALHLSLLGVTRREVPGSFAAERLDRLRSVVREQLSRSRRCSMTVTGLNLIGNQWFLEVEPDDAAWALTRVGLGAAAAQLGEAPMIHPDPEPVHLNVARLHTVRDRAALSQLLQASFEPCRFTVSTIELVVTDFVVDPATTVVVETFELPSGEATGHGAPRSPRL